MSDDRKITAAFAEGIGPVLDETPPIPEWESLQFESLSPSDGVGQWWVAAVAAALVLIVGAGSFLLMGQLGGNDEIPAASDDGAPSGVETTAAPGEVAGSIEGRWILESWYEGVDRIVVEVGVNTVAEPWIEFTSDFEGERDSFVSADGTGTAGTYIGFTGCDGIPRAGYEYSAGFLVLEPSGLEAQGCDADAEQGLDAAETAIQVLLSRNDGMEIIVGRDRMEWYGSYVGINTSYPLVFRREGAPPADPAEITPTTTIVAPEEGLAIRVFDVDGIEVVTPSLSPDLPEQATVVEFHTMVIDSGNGPELCLGGVQESLPPQCSGPVASGLDMGGWSEEAQGVRWGERSVVVSWPTVNGAVEVLSHKEYDPPNLSYPPEELPAVCVDIELAAGIDSIHEYRRSLGELDGDVYLANDGTLVLQVLGDPEPHREALAELGGACVIEVARTAAEQLAIQESLYLMLRDTLKDQGPYGSSTGPGGRVDIYVPVADRATAQFIAELVDDPTAIRLIGMGVLQP